MIGASRTLRMILSGSLTCGALFLAGCGISSNPSPRQAVSGMAIQGKVHGGQQPIGGAHVYMLAANTIGYGAASLSLLDPVATGLSDSIGAYVLTDANGNFNITGDYTCTPGQQVYLYSLGGDPGAGVNSASGLLAVLGACPAAGNFLAATPFIFINEVSTAGAAHAIAGFATDATHVSSSGTALGLQGIANAFAMAANLVDLPSGVALTVTPDGNGSVNNQGLNVVANIISSCVNSAGPASSPCSILFANALSGGTTGTAPTDTATAMLNIVHNPAANIATLFALTPAVAPFVPYYSITPVDYLIAISYTGGGVNGPNGIAIDAAGDLLTANSGTSGTGAYSISSLSPVGQPLSPASGYTTANLNALAAPISVIPDITGDAIILTSTSVMGMTDSGSFLFSGSGLTGGGLLLPKAVAVDGLNNIWVATNNLNIAEFNSAGTAISGILGFTGGGLAGLAADIAIDGSGNAWIANQFNSISKFNSAGSAVSPLGTGYTGGGLSTPQHIAIDNSGNIWVTNQSNSVSKISSSGVALSPSTGFTGGGLSAPRGLAIDGSGNVWVANTGGAISELDNSGNAISPSNGWMYSIFTAGTDVAIDGSGNVWVSSGNVIQQIVGAATPVVTPLAYAVKYNLLGSRP
ncbi:hypothetical protein SAMN05421770_101618 [Granulicella rosea]|uniref:NHL repeat containing protein n=1 Tax=Granulicella rosea TaxID=474952 RepID=A0A239DTD8_9BACT|nr:NHL repeat-containing protein [Granulicella rosea]SNS35158.1 hypothetical protein SAMN05421770_101618 [Granulicella rosea]